MVSKEYSELRMRKTQISTASSRFLEIWAEYNTDQLEFRDAVKNNLKKNIRITNSAMTDEEIENKIDSGDTDAFSAAIIKETASVSPESNTVESRHQEILKLEASIIEVHEMFMDLSNMVSMQGEQIDRIEDHIAQVHKLSINCRRRRVWCRKSTASSGCGKRRYLRQVRGFWRFGRNTTRISWSLGTLLKII
jgi:t-SNARE complex subunit (syntaxin)